MNWTQWTDAAAGLRLALLLGLAAGLFIVLPLVSGRLPGAALLAPAGILGVYLLAAVLTGMLPGLRADAALQTRILGALMITVTCALAWLLQQPAVAFLLVVPALHAALRQTQRGLLVVAVLCGVAWLLLRGGFSAHATTATMTAAIELLPLALLVFVVRSLNGEVTDSRNRITALSYRDELTGLLNMRAFTRMLQAEHQKASAGAGQYSLLMIDIDRLQVFNDRFGHEQGNRVIKAVADAIRRSTRGEDLVARYGGDEFVVFLPGAGDDIAEVVSNRIAQNVYNITLSFDRSMQRVGVNTGRAIYPDSGSTIQDMMSFADRAMYRDKEFRRSAAARKPDSDLLKRQAGVQDWG